MLASRPFVERHSLWIAVIVSLLLTLTGTNLYVDELLITFIHEACHGIAAVLTGGSIARLMIHADTSGLAYTMGGFRPIVLMAGYLGSCLWGGAMLVASRQRGWEKTVLYALSAFLLFMTVVYVRNMFGFAAGLSFGAFFAWAAWHGKGWHLTLLLSFLAVQNVFNAFGDLRDLILISSRGGPMTDAQLMSRELTMGLVPPLVFALGIAVVATVLFLLFLRLALRPEGRPISEPGSLAGLRD